MIRFWSHFVVLLKSDTQANNIQHNNKLNVSINIMVECCYAECHKQATYVECKYADSNGAVKWLDFQ